MLTKAWDLCSGAGVVAEFPVIGPDLVRMALAGNEPILAEQVTAAVESLAGTAGIASVTGAALRCRGLVDSDPEVLLEAVAAYRRSPRVREIALACEDAAATLVTAGASTRAGTGSGGAGGRMAEARRLAEDAQEIYRSLEARRDLARAQSRFRAVGLRSGPRGERPRPRRGWESLTHAELAVTGWVAQGLSNPEIARRLFISSRTVQTHVSHALEKLGLSSRVELAVETARWQEDGWGSPATGASPDPAPDNRLPPPKGAPPRGRAPEPPDGGQ